MLAATCIQLAGMAGGVEVVVVVLLVVRWWSMMV
jgi:hypothetical protein